MKKYLLPSLLILCLAGTYALAQTITRALQLSQDTTGAFSVDTNNGVYFPGHLLFPSTPRPGPSITGTGTPTISGNDTSGVITMGSSATTATVVFGTAFVTAPACVLGWQAVLAAETYSTSTTALTITQTSATSNKIGYFCPSLN